MEVCQDEVIEYTCSADGNPAVHTYQRLKKDLLVTNGYSHGMWMWMWMIAIKYMACG